MTSPVTLDETVTYWLPVVDPDASGGKVFAVGVAIPTKHADTREEVFTADGRVLMSKRVFYVETVLDIGVYIALGDFTGQERHKSASRIIGRKGTPSMFGTLSRVAV